MKVKRKQDLSAVKWSPERPVNVSGRSIGLISHALDTMAAKKRNLSNTSKKDPESCTPVSPPSMIALFLKLSEVSRNNILL